MLKLQEMTANQLVDSKVDKFKEVNE